MGPCTAKSSVAIACALLAIGCGSTGSDVGARTGPGTAVVDESAAKTGALGRKKSSAPKLEGTRCAAFVPFLPPAIEGYRAKAPAEGSDFDLGEGAALAVLRRGYWKPGISLDIEIVDTEQSKRLRDVFEQTHKLERSTEVAVIRSTLIQGHKALAQWNQTSRSNRVSVLVGSRYLVNLNLRPADGVDGAIEIAQKLDLEELAKLQPSEQIAAQN